MAEVASSRDVQPAALAEEAVKELQHAQQLKSTAAKLQQRLEELSAEAAEHTRVIDTLKDLDPKRTCFRLVGELLVERDVGSVLPELEQNLSRIVAACKKLDEQRISTEKQANEILKNHAPLLEEMGRRRVQEDQL